MPQTSPQPNLQEHDRKVGFSLRFALLVVLTGVGAGLSGGLLMKLLHAIQHLAWSYDSGTFLDAVRRSSFSRCVMVLFGAGLLAGIGRRVLRFAIGGHGGEIAKTIWFHEGRFPPLRTLGRAVLSVVIVGMGASLGREGALKQAGALVASHL